MGKARIIIILIVLLLSLIVFVQNRQAVETKLLFAKITMPLVLLLILTFIMGSVLGLFIAGYMLHKPRPLGEKQP